MKGGPDNPLGPRAPYLYRDGHDTLFRLHGTTEPETIGQAVSSGGIRLFNQDIIDLYNRVHVGTRVEVIRADTRVRAVSLPAAAVITSAASRERFQAKWQPVRRPETR